MRIWSSLSIAFLVVGAAYAQQASVDDFSIEFSEDDSDDALVDGITIEFNQNEAVDGPLPCNGFPQYYRMPINQHFYLGAHEVGSDMFKESCQSTQTKNLTAMLQDGLRYFDINLCKDNSGQLVVCSSHDSTSESVTVQSLIDQLLEFSRNHAEQFTILHFKSNNVKEPASTKDLEEAIDQVCKPHTDLTPATFAFEKRECPFIYTHTARKGAWPSMGELVNYNPEMSQWEGDGELGGARSKILITVASNIVSTPNYNPAYISPAFWRSVPSMNTHVKSASDLKVMLKAECRVPAGGIGLEAYTSGSCSEKSNSDISESNYLEELLMSHSGCNLNDSPLNTFFSFISVDNYEKELPYLHELTTRMMDVNFAKSGGNYKLVAPSTLLNEKAYKNKVERDEL